VHPPPSPARTDFTLITECTPESRGCNSVYSVVLPCNFSLEKNQVPKDLALITNSLACLWLDEIHMVEAENELTYIHTSQLGLSSYCCLPCVSVFLHMCTNNCIQLIAKIVYITAFLCFFTYLKNSPGAGFHF
jgi:hypothetical protein